jgi:hypothetical protein
MIHPLSVLAVASAQDVARATGVPWPPTGGLTDCPHCGTAATLRATPDPDCAAAWWFRCSRCGVSGDQLALADPAAPARTTLRRLLEGGAAVAVPAAAGCAGYDALASARRATQALAAEAPAAGSRLPRAVREKLGLPWPAPAAGLWTCGRSSTVRTAVGLKAGGRSLSRNAERPTVWLPVHDLPDRVVGFYHTVDPAGPAGWTFASWKRGAQSAYGGVALAAALAHRLAAWGGHTLLAVDLDDALRLHAAQGVNLPGSVAPVAALAGDPRAAGAAAARILPPGAVVWAQPNDLRGLWACHLSGAELAFSVGGRRAAAYHPSWAAQELIAQARPWPEALGLALGRLSPAAARAALEAAGWSGELAAAAGATVADRAAALLRGAAARPPSVCVGDFEVRETPAGWVCLKTGRLLSDTILVVAAVGPDPADPAGCLYAGEVRQGDRRAGFTLPAGRFRTDAVGCAEAAAVRGGLQVPYVDAAFAPHYLAVALALRPPDTRVSPEGA